MLSNAQSAGGSSNGIQIKAYFNVGNENKWIITSLGPYLF